MKKSRISNLIHFSLALVLGVLAACSCSVKIESKDNKPEVQIETPEEFNKGILHFYSQGPQFGQSLAAYLQKNNVKVLSISPAYKVANPNDPYSAPWLDGYWVVVGGY